MDESFTANLNDVCLTANSNATTMLDVRMPNLFDNNYYVDLVNRQGHLSSDPGATPVLRGICAGNEEDGVVERVDWEKK
ncbi:peroxidase [Sarracenia purpurea var. burkii]